jgi:hypothetical protein
MAELSGDQQRLGKVVSARARAEGLDVDHPEPASGGDGVSEVEVPVDQVVAGQRFGRAGLGDGVNGCYHPPPPGDAGPASWPSSVSRSISGGGSYESAGMSPNLRSHLRNEHHRVQRLVPVLAIWVASHYLAVQGHPGPGCGFRLRSSPLSDIRLVYAWGPCPATRS